MLKCFAEEEMNAKAQAFWNQNQRIKMSSIWIWGNTKAGEVACL